MGRLYSIQGLRGLAALGVVIFHVGQWAHLDLHSGAAGVDLFFVISGVIMWLVTDREKEPVQFLKRRALRIVPLYWLITLAAVGLALVFPLVAWDVQPDLGHVLKSLAFIPHYSPRGLPFPALAQGWTLNYEVLFYGLFALALLLPRRQQFLALTTAFGGIAIVGVANPPLYMVIANFLLLEFSAGMLLARAWKAKAFPGGWWGLLPIALGIVVLVLVRDVGNGFDPANWRSLAWGLPATAIVGGALSLEAAGKWPRWAWLERLGDASYAIYLTERLTISGAYTVLKWPPAWIALLAGIGAAVAVGLAVHRWIERPLLARLLPGHGPA